jgi:hypothetical protein
MSVGSGDAVGGAMTLTAGSSSADFGGSISVAAGSSPLIGGDIAFEAGSVTATSHSSVLRGGHVNITAGSSEYGHSGGVFLTSGTPANMGVGGSIVLQGGASPWVGSNIFLRPGVGEFFDGVIRFESRSHLPYGIFSEEEIEFTTRGRFDATADLFYINAHRVLFNTSRGVSVGYGPLYGFLYTTTILTSTYTDTMHAQVGIITVPVLDYYESSVTISIHNRYAVSSSIPFVTVMSSHGTYCQPKVKRAACSSYELVIELYDYYGSECTNDAQIGFFLILH